MAIRIDRNAPENQSSFVQEDETFYGGQFAVTNDSGYARVASPTVRADFLFMDGDVFVTAHQGGNGKVSLAPLGPAFQCILYGGTPQRGGEAQAGLDGEPYENESFTKHSELYCSANGKWTMVAVATTYPQNLSYGNVEWWNATRRALCVNAHAGQRI